jgi:hypothetical protein
MNNIPNEHIFFTIDEELQQDESVNLLGLLDEINNDLNFTYKMNNMTDEDLFGAMCLEYKINYNVKDLLLICEYYGISKEMKTNKCNKEEIIFALVSFENNPRNKEIVLRRQTMWDYINKLKNDKFMKKYVLW